MSFRQAFRFLFLFFLITGRLLAQTPAASPQNQDHPIRTEEYLLLLNAVAQKADPHHLYSYKMEQDGFISREGTPGHYRYVCCSPEAAGKILGDLPYFSALRFCNWMGNNSPKGNEDERTTEVGVYELSGLLNENSDPSFFLQPKAGATYYLSNNFRVDANSGTPLPSDISIDTSLASSSIGFSIVASALPATPSETTTGTSSSSSSSPSGSGTALEGASLTLSSSQSQKNIPIVPQETTVNGDPSFGTGEDLSFKIGLVTVDAPNNKAATVIAGGNTFYYGAVTNTYQISSNDITAGQYRNFLMAVARTSDPYGLFNPGMQTSPNVASIIKTTTNIVQEGVTTTIATYTVVANRDSLPITYVSYWSAIRFCNWMANGQPTNIGECNPLTTEDGSYCIVDGAPTLRPGATWRLPTEDEWFKAAYYDKKTKSYWIYSTGNQAPGNSEAPQDNQPNSPKKNANYNLNGTWTAPSSPWITPVGIFSNSPGPFGTYDMGGNVAQLTDTWEQINDPNSVTGATWKLVTRGGSWRSSSTLQIGARYGYQYIDPNDPNDGASETIGFRVVCSVSEKHTLASVLGYLFHQDATYCENNDEDALIFNSGFGYGMGFFTPFLAHAGAYWARTGKSAATSIDTAKTTPAIEEVAETALETTEVVAKGGSVCVFGPEEAIMLLGYGAAYAIYHFNVNDQTPYDANPVTKRAGVGAFVYDVGATLWTIKGFFF